VYLAIVYFISIFFETVDKSVKNRKKLISHPLSK
jgi:hypothetical protein